MSHNPAEWLAQQKAIKQAKEAEDPTPQPPSEPKLLGGATAADLALVQSLLRNAPDSLLRNAYERDSNNQEKVEYVWRTGFAPDRSMSSRLTYGLTVAVWGLVTLGYLWCVGTGWRQNAKHYAKHVIYTLTTSALYVIFDEEPSAPVPASASVRCAHAAAHDAVRACVLVATEGNADFGGLWVKPMKAHHCYHLSRRYVQAKRCSGKYLLVELGRAKGAAAGAGATGPKYVLFDKIATFGGFEDSETSMRKENDKVAFTLSSKQEAQLLGRVLGLSMPKKSRDTCEVEGHL